MFWRLAICVLSAAAVAAQEQGIPMDKPPTLPATAQETWNVKSFKFSHAVSIYDTWAAKRKTIAKLPAGSVVKGLSKLSVVHDPDSVAIYTPMPKYSLNPGDTILRYTYEGEGFADFWIKGRWYKELDGSFITEEDGNGCSKNCSGKVTKPGRKEEWLQVRMANGRVGWFRDR